MLYFGTHDYQALAGVIEKLDTQRESILKAQQIGWQEMQKRTWVDAAAEWMDVFRYAVDRHRDLRAKERKARKAA